MPDGATAAVLLVTFIVILAIAVLTVFDGGKQSACELRGGALIQTHCVALLPPIDDDNRE